MTLSKKIREQMLTMCGSLCDDDGLDSKKFHETKKERKQSDDHKRLRLCRQVAQTLSFVFSESKVESIRCLKLHEVIPEENRTALTVRLDRSSEFNEAEEIELLDILKEHEGWLRSEVAAAITRKRVPQLSFEFVGPAKLEEDCREEQ